MALDDPLDDGQAETCARLRNGLGVVRPEELGEEQGLVELGDSEPFVGQVEGDGVGSGLERDPHGVARRGDLDVELLALRQEGGRCPGFPHELDEVHLILTERLLRLPDPAKQQQVLDHPGHAL